MPANHQIDKAAKLIITTWDGEAIDNDFINALKEYQKNILAHSDYCDYNELVDLREMTRIKLTAKGLRNIGKIASNTDQFRAITKLAFIVSSTLASNLVKLYATYRNFGKKTRKQIGAFRNEHDAHEWLQNHT